MLHQGLGVGIRRRHSAEGRAIGLRRASKLDDGAAGMGMLPIRICWFRPQKLFAFPA